MRLLSARLIVSLIVGVTLVSLCTSYYQVYVLAAGMSRDLEHRAQVLGESLSGNVEHDLQRDSQKTLQKTVQQFANREHLAGLAVYDRQGVPVAVTPGLQPLMAAAPDRLTNLERRSGRIRVRQDRNRVHPHLCAAPAFRQRHNRQFGHCPRFGLYQG